MANYDKGRGTSRKGPRYTMHKYCDKCHWYRDRDVTHCHVCGTELKIDRVDAGIYSKHIEVK